LLIGILAIANIINIGADLSAMAASAELVVGKGEHVFVFAFAIASGLLQLYVPYHQYARILKWLTLSLFAYVGVLLVVHVDWPEALLGLIWPRDLGRGALLTIVAMLGTTISPYLFFWQSSQEAEEVAVEPDQHPLKHAPDGAAAQYHRIRVDTFFGMAFSNLIALAVILATAATLHAQGTTDVQTASQAAEALRPIAGNLAFALFAAGIIGTGLLAVPVLAGSAAFAVCEARGWKSGLEYKPSQAGHFYAIITAATLTGVVLDWSSLDPIKALFWSAVLNGVIAVPIMVAMMIVASRRHEMGPFVASLWQRVFGWIATAVMAAAAVAMFVAR
jgi:Mn2+/Fe2+ NRAMP family transporter